MLPSLVKETLLGWHWSFVAKEHRKVWKAGPLCLFWIVWKARNRIVFEGGKTLYPKAKKFFCFLSLVGSKGVLR